MKRKHFQPIAFYIATLLLCNAACKKYTQVEPVSEYSIPQVFADPTNAYNAVIGVYDELQGNNGYGIRLNLYYPYDSDEGVVQGNIDNGRRGIGRYQLLLTNAEVSNPFRQLYRGIEKANLCIEQIPQMQQYTSGTDEQKKELRRLYGEVLTLRAQFYFDLIRNWGDVPAPMIPAYQRKDLFIPRSDRDSTYDKILEDLATAKPLLPWRTETVRNERITRGAAIALRARIALFRGGYSLRGRAPGLGQMQRTDDYKKYYQITKDECAELMANRTQHDLNPDFADVWKKLSAFSYDPYGEILFEVGAGGGNGNSDSRMGNYDGPVLNNASRYGAGDGGIFTLANYFYAFDSVDLRRDVSITWYQVPSANNLKTLRRLGEINTGKYRRDWRVPLLPGTVLNVGFNWAMIRFSDVLLMYAEASNELDNGPSATAIAAFESVRARGYKGNLGKMGTTPVDKNGFFEAIVNERFLEFGNEGIRKYDLIRWNLLAAKIADTKAKLQQIRDRTGPYANVPQYIYWKNTGEEIQFYAGSNTAVSAQPFWQPTSIPAPLTGWTRTDWAQHLTANTVDGKPLWQGIASFFVTGKSELFPFDQAMISSYQGQLVNNPGY
jgi:hypothetical protein